MTDKVLFEVDASKIVAKLHLAGLMAARNKYQKGAFIVNTGIVNDQPNGKPDNPGKTTFNLNNPTGEYQVGYVVQLTYKKSYNADKAINAIEDLVSQLFGADSKLLDKTKDQDAKNKELDAAKSKVAASLGIPKDNELLSSLKDKDDIKKLRDLAKKTYEEDAKDYQSLINDAKISANAILLSYMQSFAGADNVKMSEGSIGVIPISESIKDANSKGLISSAFQIEPMQEAEQKKLEATFRQNLIKNPDKPNCSHKMCFFVKYTLNVDK